MDDAACAPCSTSRSAAAPAPTHGEHGQGGGQVVRRVAGDGHGWSGITWSDLAGPADADRAIAAQVRYFARLRRPFEWKLYDYDQPSDLVAGGGGRVRGVDDDEAVMVAESRRCRRTSRCRREWNSGRWPRGRVGLLIQVHERVFGRDKSRLHQDLLAQLRETPQSVAMVVAMAGDKPVSWPGGLPAGLGVRRAVGRRDAAGLARPRHLPRPDRLPGRAGRRRGYRYLTVDASADSEPILRRLDWTVPGPDHALPVGPRGNRMTTTGVAVVTGAGSGLGREITRALLGAGWRVAAAGEDALHETVTGPGLPGPAARAALPVGTDVTDAGSVAALFETVRAGGGRLDLLVNNAGMFGPAARRTRSSWRTGGGRSTPTSPGRSCARSTRCGCGSAAALSAAQLLCASAELGVVAPVLAGLPAWPAGPAAVALLALGALGTGWAYVLDLGVVRAAGPTVASTVTYVIPVWSTLIGAVLLAEPVGWNTVAGGVLVVAGVVVTRLPEKG